MASITKRGDSYRIRVCIGRDIQGKQIFENKTYHPKATTPRTIEKEVQHYAMELEQRVKEGKLFSGEKMTFAEMYEQWKEQYGKINLSTSAYEGYCNYIDKLAIPVFGMMPLSKVNPLILSDIFNGLYKEGKGLSVESLKRIKTAFNSVFSLAYTLSIIEENPLDRVKLPKGKKEVSFTPQKKKYKKLHTFTPLQAKTFLKACTKSYVYEVKGSTGHNAISGKKYTKEPHKQIKKIPTQFESFFTISIYGGMRRGEVVGLTWRDIDFENHTITIDKAITHTKSKGEYAKSPKTEAGYRTVALPSFCFDTLRKWYNEEKLLYLNLGSAWNGGNRQDSFDDCNIFIQEDGRMMHTNTPTHKFREILLKYNETVSPEQQLPVIRLHDLRHTNATLLIALGVDYETVSHRLGHEKTSTTVDIYGHALEEIDRIASDKLGQLLG